jgi:hypothetical protein
MKTFLTRPTHKRRRRELSSNNFLSFTGTDSSTSRRDFLTYCLSLMRAHNSEHRDSLPVLDVTALRHVAFVLDSIIYYMRASNDLDCDRNDSTAWDDQDDNENEDVDDEFTSSIVMDTDSVDDNDMIRPSLGKRHSFFQRSESTLCLGCPAPDPFSTPMAEAIPLAEQPQLLQPNARREDLFGMPKQAITVPASVDQIASSTLELPPIKLGLSAQSKDVQQNSAGNTNTVVISVTPSTSESQNDVITSDEKQMATVPQSKDISSLLKRPHSPQPGPSKTTTFVESYDDDDDESLEDEPQNLSTKMDDQKTEKLYEDSDDSESETIIRSPVAKKHRLMETGEVIDPKGFTIITSSGKSSKQQSPSDQDVDPSVRPPIIVVTRRTVADAIESATNNILTKNKKQTLSECVAPETPINFLPNNFVYEKGSEHDPSTSKSSVIVRVGPSVSKTFKHFSDFSIQM